MNTATNSRPTYLLTLLLGLAGLWTGPTLAAAGTFPGPYVVQVGEPDAQGQPKPMANVYVQIDARQAATDASGAAVFEGVPAGRHGLVIRHPGFEVLSQSLDIPAGQREPLALTLTRADRFEWKGRLTAAGGEGASAQPIIGATVRLTPVEVKSALRGPALGVSGWDGGFSFPDLPPGTYTLSAQATGFPPFSGPVEVRRPQEQAFDRPKVDDLALDLCRELGTNCGKPAADAFCQGQGFVESSAHEVQGDTPPTRVIGTHEDCKDAGCDRIASVLCIGKAEAQDALAMIPVSTPAEVRIEVQDSVTHAPLAGARVVLAETWPSGLAGEAQTDAKGIAAFDALQMGLANWADGQGRVERIRRRLSAHIEADGYAPRTVPVEAGEGSATEVLLDPATPMEAPEDDSGPLDVRIDAPVTFTLERNDDSDLFRFRLEQPARLTVLVGPVNPLQTLVRVMDGLGQVLREQGTHAGQDNRIELWVQAGTFLAEVSEWGRDASGAAPLTLTVSAEYATDPNEPNEAPEAAALATIGGEQAGLIWPKGDRDFYRFEAERPGVLRIREPGAPFQRHIRVFNTRLEQVAEQGVHANQGLDLQVQVEPGSYTLSVEEWGNDDASLSPYRLRIDLLPDDGIDDPAPEKGRMNARRTLPLGAWTAATLLPRGDRDIYSLAVPGAGVVHVQAMGPGQRHVEVYDPKGQRLAEQGVHGGQWNRLAVPAEGPTTLYVSIREWGDDDWSAVPYALHTRFEPADEIDFAQRNDDFDRATPAQPGETLRGSYLPRGDHDVYVVEIDFPGYLHARLTSAHQSLLRIFDGNRVLVAEQGVHGGQTADLRPQVNRGLYFVSAAEWGDDDASPAPFRLDLALERAEPAETWPLSADSARRLQPGEAQAFSFDHRGDRDRFLFEVAEAGKVWIAIAAPHQTLVQVFDDRTGERLHESGHHAPARPRIPIEVAGPTRLRIELREWGDDDASLSPGLVLADTQERPLAAALVSAEPEAGNPLRVAFKRQAMDGVEPVQSCDIDANRDGRPDLGLSDDRPKTFTFKEPGVYVVEALCSGASGQRSRQRLWVQATGPQDRAGVALFLPAPAEGQVLDAPLDLRAQALSYDGSRIAQVAFTLDGKPLSTDYDAPFEAQVNWRALAAGEHRLQVSARDAAGVEAELSRKFSLSEYFGLTPPDGAVLSGEGIRVSWTGPGFGPSKVRYRKKGEEAWQEAVGESGHDRSLTLTGLEPATPYEFQPLGGKEEGPLRTLTRVKGLAFGQPRYGANIRRDYDQKVGISVRNNGEAPLKVRLECGRPKDPLLLVGFVGEGSEDKPFELAPGEERQFLLALSAQDVNTEDHSVPIRIVSDNGLNDEAEVAVHVQLPKIELTWEDKGPAPNGQGRIYRLVNTGDPITDLAVVAADPTKVSIHPTVRHGLMPSYQSQDFTVTPRFHEGFTGVKTRLIAHGLDKRFEQPYEMKLGPGEKARRIWLFPGKDPTAETAPGEEQELINRAQRAEGLKAADIDWTRRDNPEDTDGDGRIDRWSQRVGDLLWVGDDSDADGEVDFVHADVGDDGMFEYSALLEDGKWRPTNLVEAWLEMGFSLRGARQDYQAHSVDIVFNGQTIGRLKDMIPNGNYAFRIPPRSLKFDSSGALGDNQVGLSTTHLRGGHYAVTSDFRFKLRLTATPVWTVAKDEAQARAQAGALTEVSVSAPDLSVSSADLRLLGPAQPKAGDDLVLEVPLRNLGSSSPVGVPLVLTRTLPNGQTEELARTTVEHIALDATTQVQVPFKARGGANQLTVTIDPEDRFKDLDRANNQGMLFVQVAGDDVAPTLKIGQPADGQTLTDTLVPLIAEAGDDQALAGVQLSIDGGLWQDLEPANGRIDQTLLLQPGDHRLELKATDYSGNTASQRAQVRIDAKPPEARLVTPQNGATLDVRGLDLAIEAPADAAQIGVRTAGGPWHKASLVGTQAGLRLPLRFGPQTIEVLVADKRGAVTLLKADVTCTKQPAEGEATQTQAASDQGLLWPADRPDLEIDLFKATSGLFSKLAIAPAEKAQRLREDARRRQAQGDYAGAYNKYRESLVLEKDPQVADRVKKLEVYLNVK